MHLLCGLTWVVNLMIFYLCLYNSVELKGDPLVNGILSGLAMGVCVMITEPLCRLFPD